MNWELYIGLAGGIAWGLICSYYIWRDRYVTVTMVLPFVLFIIMIANGVGKL